MKYKILQGDCLERLDELEDNSIDCIVTDPPYGLVSITKRFGKEGSAPAKYGKDGSFARLSRGFMGKEWDGSGIEYNVEMWQKCLRVLKPGGYLLAFGGTRTYHRIACAIENAGFEIRDCIQWVYGCYSADTQVLTDMGWKYFYNLDKTEHILQWDKTTNQLSWVKPKNYFEYNIDDELMLFENRHISQLVTKNHKVAVSVKRRRKEFEPYELIEAQDIQKSWQLNFPLAGELAGEIDEPNAYLIGWWLTDAWTHTDGKAIMFSQSKPKTLAKLKDYLDTHNIKYSEYIKKAKKDTHHDEHTFYIAGEIAQELLTKYTNRELTWEILKWNTKSRQALLEGLMDGDGSRKEGRYAWTFWSQRQERLDIFQALCVSLNYRAFINKKGGVEFNVKRNSTQTQARHRKRSIPYKGKVYCLETETGAFVVRRGGRAFISGNSGFPKSTNIGLAIDKKNGVESEVVGEGRSGASSRAYQSAETTTAGAYQVKEARNEWKGWGSALKPSWEPIVMARKPFKGSLVDNVLQYGVGGLNIDECRVETGDKIAKNVAFRDEKQSDGWETKRCITEPSSQGRFPANTILTYDENDFEEVCGGFPNTKQNGSITNPNLKNSLGNRGIYNKYSEKQPLWNAYQDSGSAARYFYCAKASRKDRDEGLGYKAKENAPPEILRQIKEFLNDFNL